MSNSVETRRMTGQATQATGGTESEKPENLPGEPAVTDGKEPHSIPAEKEPPPALFNEGKPLLVPEEPIPDPTSETPSPTIINEKHTPIPRDLQHLTRTEEEHTSRKAGSEGHATPVTEKPPVAEAEESPPFTPDKGSPTIITPEETPPPQAEYLAPTKDTTQSPALNQNGLGPAEEIETPPVVEEKPSIKEPTKAVEAEKFPEKAPATVEEHPVVEAPPTVKEEVLPEGAPPQEPLPSIVTDKHAPVLVEEKPVVSVEKETLPGEEMPPLPSAEPLPTPVTEGKPPALAERETPPPTVDKEPPATTPAKEPPPTPAEETLAIEKEKGVEPLAEAPEISEKPVTLPEPPKLEGPKEAEPAWDIWHVEPVEMMMLGIAIILIAAKIGGEVARLLRVPEVVGKVIIGMLLGNLYFFTGWNFFNFLRVMPFLENLAYFGALTLLLSAGIHTDLKALLKVGVSSVLVCLGGMIAPAGLGLLAGHFLLPDTPVGTKFLMATVLCSSSIGLILATLQELKSINTPEGKVLTGAAILTEIAVILTFGIVSGVVVRGRVATPGVFVTIGIVLAFLAAIFVTNLVFAERLGNLLTRKVPEHLKISIAATLCLLLAFIAKFIGLVAIIGTFAAGLFLRHMKLIDSNGREYSVEWLISPAYMTLVPIFFVWVGAQVDWESLLNVDAVFLGLAVTGAAFLGKLFCSVCPINPGINRMAIGVGMMAKLEGVLILSGIGRKMGIFDDVMFSSFIAVVVLASVISPLLLKLLLARKKRPAPVSFLSRV